MNVIKRNGSIEPFDSQKIYRAVMKAAIAVDEHDFEPTAEVIAENVEFIIGDSTEVSIEDIQDLVEIELYNVAHNPKMAKAYILYREKRKQEREKINKYKKIIEDRAVAPEISDQKQNANVDEKSFSGRMYEASEALWKETALDDFMPKEIADLHREGELYEHDLSRWAIGQHNCCSPDTWIKVKFEENEPKLLTFKEFAEEIGLFPDSEIDLSKENIKILSRNGWTRIKNCISRSLRDSEKIYRIKTFGNGISLKCTEDHIFPVLVDGKEETKQTKELSVGDLLLRFDKNSIENDAIKSIEVVEDYNEQVYDIETGDHWFIANNIIVHNCTTFDVTKIFKDGLITRQSHLRPPSRFASACQQIAVIMQIISQCQFGE